MNIKFKDLKCYCLTVPWATERIERVKKTFHSFDIEIEFLYGEKTNPYAKGLAEMHIKALENSGSHPCLIVEDDVILNSAFKSEDVMNMEFRDLPPWADALYIGTSVFGRIRNNTVYWGLLATDYSDKYVRVFNKLSMHAVVHISNDYKNSCIKTFKKYIDNPIGGCDDPIADMMKYHNVFSLRRGILVQQDGHSDEATNAIIKTIL